MEFGGRQVVDTAHLHYYGNSLGGIIGDVYMAVTTDVIRGQSISLSLFLSHVCVSIQ